VLSLAHERSFRRARGWRKITLFLKWQLTRIYEKRICQKVRTVVALSETDQKYLQTQLRVPRVPVIHSGVDVHYFTPGHREEDPDSLLFVGYFKHPPNVEAMHYFFRELWKPIRESVPGLRVTVVGRFAPAEILAYSQWADISFQEYAADLRPLLEQHAVFIAPILSGAGLRGKILEALAMGKATVATRRCMDGYPFQHGRELMIAENSQQFIQYTIDLLRDPAQRQKLGQGARKAVEDQFGADRSVAAYEALYDEI
jgi:polysaccharide biosynthesis protein PslH